jgi:hypothetical protein
LCYWLVVDLPLWKIRVRQLGWWNSQLYGNNKLMFQTTRKACFNWSCYLFISQPLRTLVVLGAALAIVLPTDLQHSEPGWIPGIGSPRRLRFWGTAPEGVFIFFQPVALIKTTLW